MKPIPCAFVALLLGVLLFAGETVATPALDASIGFSSSVVAREYAPAYVTLTGLPAGFNGTVRVIQHIGTLSEDPDVVINDIASGELENGQLVGTIPVYDPLNPVAVQLLNAAGETVAQEELNLRLFTRTTSFPLVVGETISLGGSEVRVDATHLPLDWWAYEAIASIWISGATLGSEGWETIARWVYVGGSVVVFTGSDYFRVDSSILQEMFPTGLAVLRTLDDGTERLDIGAPGAAVSEISAQDGTVLAYQRAYGAGTVTLVPVRASDMSEEAIRELGEDVPSTRVLSLTSYGTTYHGSIRVPRPPYLVAPIMALALIGCAALLRYASNERGAKPHQGMVMAVGITIGVLVGASVFAGLYTNREKQLIELYQLDIVVNLQQVHGISIGYSAFFAFASTLDVEVEREGLSAPAHSLLKTVAGAEFSSLASSQLYEFSLQASEFREVRVYGAPRQLITFDVNDAETLVSVSNYTSVPITTALLVVDGMMYRLPNIVEGDQTIALPEAQAVQLIWSVKEYGSLLQEVTREYGVQESGSWLILVSDDTRFAPGTFVPRKVRHLELYVVAAEEVSG